MKKLTVLLFLLSGMILCAGETYNFFMLSDTHFGAADSFADKVAKSTRLRADKAMPVYKAMFADMAKKADSGTRFLVHAGDIIEGNAKNAELQTKEFEKAVTLLKNYFKFPIYYARGNHETSGGSAAYLQFMLPEIARNAGKTLKVANYSFRNGSDLFIFADSSHKSWLNFITQTLKNNKSSIRYLFVVLHIDYIVPFRDKPTKELCKLLSQYNTLVLHGHSHQTVTITQNIDGKPITSFSIGSYLTASPKAFAATPSTDPAREIARIRRQGRLDAPPARKEFFDKISLPFITKYQRFSIPGSQGYARIMVSDSGVIAMVQSANLKYPPIKIQLLPAAK